MLIKKRQSEGTRKAGMQILLEEIKSAHIEIALTGDSTSVAKTNSLRSEQIAP